MQKESRRFTRKHLARRFPLIRRALRAKRQIRGTVSHRSIPSIIVCSPGGVATTMLIDHIQIFREINSRDNRDGLKHLPAPPPPPTKTLFVFGDADTVVQSITRRGWSARQCANLGTIVGVLTRGRLRNFFLKRAVKNQVRRFSMQASKGHILALNWEHLWDSLDAVSSFLELDGTDFARSFPARKPRSSDSPSNPR